MSHLKTVCLLLFIMISPMAMMANKKPVNPGACHEEKKVADSINKRNKEIEEQEEEAKTLFDEIAREIKLTSAQDYAIEFPNMDVTDYVIINPASRMPSLSQFTVCLWMKSTSTGDGTQFSYAVPGNDNEITFWAYGEKLYLNRKQFSHPSMLSNDGKWHHTCYSWSNIYGLLKGYKDGVLIFSTQNFKKGYTVKGKGSLVLGQDQDDVGSGFQTRDSYKGSLAGVSIWSYVVPPEKIKEMFEKCPRGEGDIYKWCDFTQLQGIKGNAKLVKPFPCDVMC